MAGISDKAVKTSYAENKYRWNKGSELQHQEFSDGTGLEMYEAALRELDPQLGRWWQIDPVFTFGVDGEDEVNDEITEGLKSQSPYASMDNNPVRFEDPNGDCPPCTIAVAIESAQAGTAAATAGAASGSSMGAGEALVAATGAFFGGAVHGMEKAWDAVGGSLSSTGSTSSGSMYAVPLGNDAAMNASQPAATMPLSPAGQEAMNNFNVSLGMAQPQAAIPTAPLAANPTVPPSAITATHPPISATVEAHAQKKQSTGSLKKSGDNHMRQFKNNKKGNTPNKNQRKGAEERRTKNKPID
jgi:RHS repeat-associated protein